MKLGRDGALTIPLVLLLSAAVFASLGTWALLRHWRHLVEDQLRLDHCVAQKAVELKTLLEKANTSNHRMIKIRQAAGPAAAAPGALSAIQTELNLEVALQEALRTKWETERIKWFLPGACGDRNDVTLSMPGLDWTRDPPDAIGPQPFHWSSSNPRFYLEIQDQRRAAAAQVAQKAGGLHESWKARWQVPGGASLP
jgi:hypothetical protein